MALSDSFDQLAVVFSVAHQLTIHGDLTAVVRLQEVDTAQQRRLPRAAGPDDCQHVAGVDLQVESAQYVQFSKALFYFLYDNDLLAHSQPFQFPGSSSLVGEFLFDPRAHRRNGVVDDEVDDRRNAVE